jgi:hypothetical protein
MQPLVTVWRSFGCVLQPCSVVTAVFAKAAATTKILKLNASGWFLFNFIIDDARSHEGEL